MIKHLLSALALTVGIMCSANAQVMRSRPLEDNSSPPAPTRNGPTDLNTVAGEGTGNCSPEENVVVTFSESQIIVSCKFERPGGGQETQARAFVVRPDQNPFLASVINETVFYGTSDPHNRVGIRYEDRRMNTEACSACYPLLQIYWISGGN